jgi:hypothetical protein
VIDPSNITQFNCTRPKLEELILFWVCAAGKNGKTAARCLDRFLKKWRAESRLGGIPITKRPSPFYAIQYLHDIWRLDGVVEELRDHGIGCYNHKAKTFVDLAYSGIDLKTCTVDELEEIKGIGPKTARCFLIHSRPNQRYAGLDTHVLKYMREKGYEVPKSTPSGKRYREIERQFLSLADEAGKTVAEFDLEIWNEYSTRRRPIQEAA